MGEAKNRAEIEAHNRQMIAKMAETIINTANRARCEAALRMLIVPDDAGEQLSIADAAVIATELLLSALKATAPEDRPLLCSTVTWHALTLAAAADLEAPAPDATVVRAGEPFPDAGGLSGDAAVIKGT